jgi:DNA-binding transcriptional LysR family regulator
MQYGNSEIVRRDGPGFSVTQLRAFAVVAETLSYVEAAERLGYTEPAVHHQVKRLEAALGCALLERVGRAVQLTTDGKRLLPQCLAVLREADQLVALVEHPRPPNSLTIAAGRLTSAYILPEVLASIRETDPPLTVELLGGDRIDVLNRVRAGEADLGLSGSLDEIVDPAEFSISRWRETQFTLFESPVGAPGGPLTIYALRKSTRLSEIVAGLAVSRDVRVVCVPTPEAVKRMCMAGLGAGFLRHDSVHREVEAGLLRPHRLFPSSFEVSVWAIQSRKYPPSAAVARFLRLSAV